VRAFADSTNAASQRARSESHADVCGLASGYISLSSFERELCPTVIALCSSDARAAWRMQRRVDPSCGKQAREGDRPLYTVVTFLVVMTVAALALIYWGGFKEESRNS
jgi:hypothetical protein